MAKQKIGDKWIEVGFNDQDVDEIKFHTPVRTGDLQSGFILESVTGDIINAVHYAGFVEYGTVKMAGRFMVHQAAPAILQRLDRDIARQLGEGPPPLFKLPEIVIKL